MANLFGGGGAVENVLDQPVVPQGITIGKVAIFGGAIWLLGHALRHSGWRKNPSRRHKRRGSYRRRR